MSTLYDTDFYQWCELQSVLLITGKLDDLDLNNLAEEIASMGRREKDQFINRLALLICHILKWEYQEHLRCNSWKYTIWEQQKRSLKLIRQNPSLTNKETFGDCIVEAYSYGRLQASKETGIDMCKFPEIMEFNPLEYKII